jgi:organic hydroperoxide reductase OsmC/OhrA
MADIDISSVSEEGYTTTSILGEWELTVDAAGENGPEPNEVLAADYASCFIPAFRVGANKEGFDDIGTVEIDVWAQVDDNDDLETISFDIAVEESLGDSVDAVVERAEDICHVHDALREELHADVTVEDDADL